LARRTVSYGNGRGAERGRASPQISDTRAPTSEATQAKQWRARKSGLQDHDEPSEVRNLNHDTEAKAQAEAAMQRMMAKQGAKPKRGGR
jgi:hypothetical protein